MSSPRLSLSELAARLGRPVEGGPGADPLISGISTLQDATQEQISFVSNPKLLAKARESRAAALLVGTDAQVAGKPTIAFDNVWRGVLAALNVFHPQRMFAPGVHPAASVDPGAALGEGASVQAGAVIEGGAKIGARTVIEAGVFIGGNVEIGDDSHLHPNVVVRHGCKIGSRVIIQPGAVIGADGFKYEYMDNQHTKIPQVGVVVIEDDVEIGANTCIDRASFTETRIGAGTKIDNLVQIAHNDRIGRQCIIVAQVGLSGSVTVGDGAILAGQVGSADNITIGARAIVGARSGLHRDVPEGAVVLGAPAQPQREMARIYAAWNRLPDALEELRNLRKRVEELEKKP